MRVVGPIFSKEMIETSRRGRYFFARTSLGLLVLLVMSIIYFNDGKTTYSLKELGDLGNNFFLAWLWCQFCLLALLTPVLVCGLIAAEKENGSLELLFTTDLRNREILLGKLASRIFLIFLILFSSLPVVTILSLFGGVDLRQLLLGCLLTLSTCLLVGSMSLYYSITSSRPWVAMLRTYFTGSILWFLFPFLFIVIAQHFIPGPAPPWMYRTLGLTHPLFSLALLTVPGAPLSAGEVIPEMAILWLGISAVIFGLCCWRLRKWVEWRKAPLTWRLVSAIVPFPWRAFLWICRRIGNRIGIFSLGSGIVFEPFRNRLIEMNPILYRNMGSHVYDPEHHLATIQFLGWGMTILMLGILESTSTYSYLADPDTCVGAVTAQMIGLHLILVTIAAGSIARERQRGTLDLLLTTTMTPTQIVLGNFQGVLMTVFPTFLLIFGTTFLGWAFADYTISFLLYYLFLLFAISLSIAAGATLISVASKNVGTATALAFIAPIFFWMNSLLEFHRIPLWLLCIIAITWFVFAIIFVRVDQRLRQIGVVMLTISVPIACFSMMAFCVLYFTDISFGFPILQTFEINFFSYFLWIAEPFRLNWANWRSVNSGFVYLYFFFPLGQIISTLSFLGIAILFFPYLVGLRDGSRSKTDRSRKNEEKK